MFFNWLFSTCDNHSMGFATKLTWLSLEERSLLWLDIVSKLTCGVTFCRPGSIGIKCKHDTHPSNYPDQHALISLHKHRTTSCAEANVEPWRVRYVENANENGNISSVRPWEITISEGAKQNKSTEWPKADKAGNMQSNSELKSLRIKTNFNDM